MTDTYTTSISTYLVHGQDGTEYAIYPDTYHPGEWIIRVRPPNVASLENIIRTLEEHE